MSVRVILQHDDSVKLWEVFVEGASSPTEARQAWTAAAWTIQELDHDLLSKAKVIQVSTRFPLKYEIHPARRTK